MARTVGIRFRQAGKIFYYDAGDLELQSSNYVVVETAHGLSVGRVVIAPDQVISQDGIIVDDLKPILRFATPEDIERADEMKERASNAVVSAKQLVSEHGLDMSIANGEFDLEGGQFTAYFTATERVDFRNLVRDLSRDLSAHVQLLQVGDRDRAKLVDGIDICGERLCCSSWMTNFPSVSIRMAKEQDLPLNPQKISGVCGRLYCCLTFEYEDYKQLRGTLPKVGSFLSTPAGEAKVLGIDFNREMVKLMITSNREIVEVAAIDFQLQHGVTIRPMELVRKIEGPLRPITESSESQGSRLPVRNRPGRSSGQPRAGGGGAAPATPNAGAPERTERPERPARPPRGERPSRPERPGREAPAQPTAETPSEPQQRGRRGRTGGPRAPGGQPAASLPPQQSVPPTPPPSAEGGEAGGGEAQRRRRRRRRGRGGGGGGSSAEGGGAPEASSD